MRAEITIQAVFYNSGLSNYFLRDQAKNQLEELIDRCTESENAIFAAIENYCEDYECTLDDVEEFLHSESLEGLADMFGLELEEEEEEEEEEQSEE